MTEEGEHDNVLPARTCAACEPLMSQLAHDLSGALVIARGFAGELQISRDIALKLLKDRPESMDAQLHTKLLEQVDEEMQFCLQRVSESLIKLDHVIERLRP